MRTAVHLPVLPTVSSRPEPGPELSFAGLDVLWLQIAGTVCNIACRHCFISCGPKNDSHPLMEREQVLGLLDEARELGVKEYYFTGGEPFLHPDVLELSERTLRQGPLTILTNGLLLDEGTARAVGRLAAESEHSFDLRVSLDGTTAEENDPVRGKGTFEEIVAGARRLLEAGVNPVFTVTTVHVKYVGEGGATRFLDWLRSIGFERPRVKLIPPFQLGRESQRTSAYPHEFVLGEDDLFEGEEHVLQCGSCRAVTAKGVYPCPILVEEDGARMGSGLDEALHPIRLNHPACVTCHVEGFTCRT